MEHSKRGISKREPTEEDSANNRTKKYLTIGVVQQKVGLSFGHSVTETVVGLVDQLKQREKKRIKFNGERRPNICWNGGKA